jgi:hypothetical protein
MWIHPSDGNFIINGNDGGVGISRDRGKTWRFVQNLPVAQYYHIAVDMERPYNIYGGMQDNGSWRGPNTVWENGGIRNHHWQEVAFGDGFDTRPHPQDSQMGYAMSQVGYLRRWNLRTGEQRLIRPAPPEGERLRFNWNAALAQDPFEPDTIYYGSQYVHKSTDRGDSWVRISGDLTTNNPDWQKQDESGGLTPDVTGAENFCSIVSLAPSPLERGVLWAGSDDGRLHLTRDGGASWTSLETRIKGVPEHTWIPHICASPHDAATAFVVFDDHRRGNLTPYVYVTRDYGRSWKNLSSEKLSGYALVVEQDPVDPDLLFLGTEFGLYVSLDGGKDWMRWTHGVPTVSVMDLVVHPREHDLVLGTHGRAAFVLDDIRPLRSLDAEVLAEPLHLFEIAPAQQYWEGQTGAERFPGATEFRGETRAYGAIVNFVVSAEHLPHPNDERERARKQSERESQAAEKASSSEAESEPELSAEDDRAQEKAKPATEVEVEILDSDGERIRSFRRDVHRGLNRIHWNLRSDPFRRPPSDDEDWMGTRAGPEVPAGDYTVVLRFGEHEARQPLTVLADPRMDINPAARRAAWEATQRAGAVSEKMAEALIRIVDARNDCDLIMERIQRARRDEEIRRGRPFEEQEDKPHEDLKKAARKMRGRLDELEETLRIRPDSKGIPGGVTPWGELSLARWYLGSSWGRPTPTAMEHLERAEAMVAEALETVNRFFAEEMPPFREQVGESGVVQILTIPEPVELPAP